MRARLHKLLSSLLVGCPGCRLAASAPDCCWFLATSAVRGDTGSQPAGQSRTSQAKRSEAQPSEVSESRRSKAKLGGAKRSPANQTNPRGWVGCRGCNLAGCVPEPPRDAHGQTDSQPAADKPRAPVTPQPSEAKRILAKPSKAKRSHAKPTEPKRPQAKPREAKRSQAKPNETKRSQAKPAKPNEADRSQAMPRSAEAT